MPVTRFGLEGYGVRRVGSFVGKTTSAQPITVVTPSQPSGGGKRRKMAFFPYVPRGDLRKLYRELEGKTDDVELKVRAKVEPNLTYEPPVKPVVKSQSIETKNAEISYKNVERTDALIAAIERLQALEIKRLMGIEKDDDEALLLLICQIQC